MAVHTGIRLQDGKNYNLRAYLHSQAKDYLAENEVSLVGDPTFLAQAIAIQAGYKGGALLIESKEEYRARLSGATSKMGKKLGRSPDRWDAFVLSFIPPSGHLVENEILPGKLLPRASMWRPLDASMSCAEIRTLSPEVRMFPFKT